MKTVGIIAEYNPFHNGHGLHLEQSLNATGATHSLVVMSGDFVQRGEPAILDKWTRARMAVDSGVNLVIELPVETAISSAEGFASGAVNLLGRLGVVDVLSFGSESMNLGAMTRIAHLLADEPPEFKALLKRHLDAGLVFPSARQRALEDLGIEGIPTQSNDILGIEYLKAIRRSGLDLPVHLVKRQHVDYHSHRLVNHFASATGIREWIHRQDFLSVRLAVPESSFEKISTCERFMDSAALYPLLRYRLLSSTPETLSKILEMNEGLGNRMAKAAREHPDYLAFLEAVKTKRYTLTRIKRAGLHLLLEMDRQCHESDPRAIRLLAADDLGLALLRRIKDRSTLPIVTNLGRFATDDPEVQASVDLTVRASELYALIGNAPIGDEYRMSPYIRQTTEMD